MVRTRTSGGALRWALPALAASTVCACGGDWPAGRAFLKTGPESDSDPRPDERGIPVIIQLSGAQVTWAAEPVATGLQREQMALPRDMVSRRREVARALREMGSGSESGVVGFLADHGVRVPVSLPLIHAVAARVPPELIPELASLPGVESVRPDGVLQAPASQKAADGTSGAVGWNLELIGAPRVWALGDRGAGVVVANMDTGVDLAHPDLGPGWRGGSNSWFDPIEQTPSPVDPLGHGTQTMGLVVGAGSSGAPVGVAPEARWIAARIYDRAGQTHFSTIHQAFAWLLDPDGDPATDDAPDVVNASWGEDDAGACDPEFQPDLDALRAAGITVVFASGNSGPQPGTSVSPANLPDAFAAGAVDAQRQLAVFSSTGPSACTGGIFPTVVAPGVSVRTTDLSLAGAAQYASVSGTSFAAPHVAGAAALLRSAHPELTPQSIEEALRATAEALGPEGPDNLFGHGLLDVAAAYTQLTTPVQTALQVKTAALPMARVGRRFRARLAVMDGAAGAQWSVSAGAVPPGLSLDSSGLLDGVPGEGGKFELTIRVDAPGRLGAERTLTLTVLPNPWLVGHDPRGLDAP